MKTEKLISLCHQHVVIRFKVKKFVNKYLQRWFVYITCDTLELIITIWYYLNILIGQEIVIWSSSETRIDLEKHVLTSGKHSFISAIDGSSGVLPDCTFSKISTNFLKFQNDKIFKKFKKKSVFIKFQNLNI